MAGMAKIAKDAVSVAKVAQGAGREAGDAADLVERAVVNAGQFGQMETAEMLFNS